MQRDCGHAAQLWTCGATVDMVAVPYFVHRDDLAKIAPLWKRLTVTIKQVVGNNIGDDCDVRDERDDRD